MLSHREINLHWVDSPKFALQAGTIYVEISVMPAAESNSSFLSALQTS